MPPKALQRWGVETHEKVLYNEQETVTDFRELTDLPVKNPEGPVKSKLQRHKQIAFLQFKYILPIAQGILK